MSRLLLVVVSSLLAGLAPPVAQANVTATYAAGQLVVTSDNAGTIAETVTVTDEGANVAVVTNAGLVTDPDGGSTTCVTAFAGKVICNATSVDLVRVVAGTGVDTLTDAHTSSPTRFEGGPGDDVIKTVDDGTEADMRGEAGLDQLTAASPDDVLTGGDDADTLTATGDHALDNNDIGGPGNDTFFGNAALSDNPPLDPGNDTYALGTRTPGPFDVPGPALQFAAADVVSYDGAAGAVTVTLDGIANDGRAGEQDNVGADVEVVEGTDANDVLQAGANAAALSGGNGADQLLGGPGPDELEGGGGNDVLRGGDGDDRLEDGDFTIAVTAGPQPAAANDTLDGGGGDDVLQADRGADDLSGGTGFDRTELDRPIPQTPAVTTPIVPASFTVSLDDAANDGQTGTGEGDNVRSDIEQLTTTGGNDVIGGGGGANDIRTGAGDDVVDPGGGADIVDLGVGDDRVAAEDQTTDVLRCSGGSDTATVDLPGAQAARADALFDCETVSGTPFPALVAPAPPAVPAPSVDTRRPVVTLTGKTIKSADFLKNGRLEVTVACNEACSASGEAFTTLARIAKAGNFSIGTGALRLGAARRALRITVARKYRSRFRSKLRTKAQKRRGVKFEVEVTVRDAAGNVTSASRGVTVKG